MRGQCLVRVVAAAVGVAVCGAIVGVAGCQSGPPRAPRSDVQIADLVGTWVLTQIEGSPVGRELPEGSRRPSLTIDAEGSVSGFGGVNRLATRLDPLDIPRGRFHVGPIAATKMAGPPAAMALEDRFVRLLAAAETFQMDGGALVVLPGGKGAPMRMERADGAGR